jgi:aminoglycoside phosphotransferase family enzyme/predicted kinase
VTGTPADPRFGGDGQPIEAAVHMRAFPQQALWSERIARGTLAPREIDDFAALLAGFHARAQRSPPGSPWGTARAVAEAAARNMDELAPLTGPGALSPDLEALRTWLAGEARRLATCFDKRKRDGAVRQCHGDLHCENILTLDGKAMAFDCIEFDESLHWLDVMHDLAFALMDLRCRGEGQSAARLLNGYLEHGGDCEGLAVLRYYMTGCALVRAKISMLRARNAAPGQAGSERQRATGYIATAWQIAGPVMPALIVMHGLSGSGKSTVARRLVELVGAVQLRSDVERRRTPGVDARTYDQHTSNMVYKRLRALAANVLAAGYPVVIDAANLKRSERRAFERLAKALGVPWAILETRAPMQAMRERIERRGEEGVDPSEANVAVLEMQRAHVEHLSPQELDRAIVVDTCLALDEPALQASLAALLHL